MKVSIITPSFNQAEFLPDNLVSIAIQSYRDIEHIIVDPGSTDGSTEIARQSPSSILINEADKGQSDGIAKGFRSSTGDILAWLNSDDYYPHEKVIESVVNTFKQSPDVSVVYGNANFVDAQGDFLRKGFVNADADKLLDSFEYQVGVIQPAVFWRRRVFEEVGGPSEKFNYCMDYELWVRMASSGYKWKHIPDVLAHHRWWGGMKTSSRRDLSLKEHFIVCISYFGYVHWRWIDRYADFLATNMDGIVNHAPFTSQEEKQPFIQQAIDEFVTEEMLLLLAQATGKEKLDTLNYISINRKANTPLQV